MVSDLQLTIDVTTKGVNDLIDQPMLTSIHVTLIYVFKLLRTNTYEQSQKIMTTREYQKL